MNKFNSIKMNLADRTIRKIFVMVKKEKRNLGLLYGFVQNEVNTRLGYTKR